MKTVIHINKNKHKNNINIYYTMLPKINNYFIKSNKSQCIKIFPEFDFKMKFDGCSKGNPGLAGAGAIIYHLNKEHWSDFLFVGEMCTNNHAEYAGLILGLQQAKEFGIKYLMVEGDSLLVINQMKELYKCKSKILIDLYKQAKELESHFNKVEYVHIYRNQNKRADELSNVAIEKYLKIKQNHLIYDDSYLDDNV